MFVPKGAEWKRRRARFNAGSSANAILNHTAQVQQEAQVFADIIREHTDKGDMFSSDGLTCWFTIDVIRAVAL